MSPIVVEATRGDVVEARHVVHAVAVRDGGIELAAGEPGLVTFLRSSAKPLQALPVVRARPDLDDEQVALLCASHRATPEQLAIVRRILADAPATEELLCGPVAADALLIGALDGWVAKGGAEGLFCAASSDGLGVALKVSDGAFRAIRPALAHVLERLGLDPGDLGDVDVRNSRDERVGDLRVVAS